jgi:hypothetical protein
MSDTRQGSNSARRLTAARTVYEYLAVRDPLPERADCVIGFGHFDPAIAARCCELYLAGQAGLVAFTGGNGAGSADLDCPEAEFFRRTARERFPSLPDAAFVLETRSTNTGENVAMLAEVLAARAPALRFGAEMRSAVLVASPYRQRRVWLTCRLRLPGVRLHNAPPESTLEGQQALFASKGQDLLELLVGEVDRLVRYSPAGFIAQETVPESVLDARRVLRGGRSEY